MTQLLRAARTTVLCTAVCTAIGWAISTGASAVDAQRYADTPVRMQGTQQRAKALPRITLNIKNTPRVDAIRSAAKAAGYEVVFSETVVNLKGNVSLRFTKMPLDSAILEILRGTGIGSRVYPDAKSVVITPGDSVKDSNPQQGGRIRGRVVDSVTKEGLANVTVMIEGTQLRALTDAQGMYSIASVSAGRVRMAVRQLGYRAIATQFTLGDNQDTTINFQLAASASTLAEVVTTGSGERERVQVGNSIATIKADEVVENNLVKSLTDLLNNRAPGLQVQHMSGTVGTAQRIRIRGISSVSSSNDPIVIIDGVRASSDYAACRQTQSAPCEMPSRLDDIDPNNIESIDVLKGPAASTLFGSDAANGVIVIKTKRGRAGPTRWGVRGDYGFINQSKDYPTSVVQMGYDTYYGNGLIPCSLSQQFSGYCVKTDSVLRFNPFTDSRTSPLATGYDRRAGIDVSGGTQTLQYFFSAGIQDALGTAKMPDANIALYERVRGQKMPRWMERPNSLTNVDGTGRVTGQFNSKSDFSIGSTIIRQSFQNGPNGLVNAVGVSSYNPADTMSPVLGWATAASQQTQNVARSITNASTTWRPWIWASANIAYGWDESHRNGRALVRRNDCAPFCPVASTEMQGSINVTQNTTTAQSVNMGATFTYRATSDLSFRTSTGGQYVKTIWDEMYTQSSNLPDGRTDIGSALGAKFVTNFGESRATAGAYIEQGATFRERLFANIAARRDVASGMGPDGVAPIYPKFSVSWLASNEDFFPWKDQVSFRLRGAFGHAGVQPAVTDRLRTYSQSAEFLNPDNTILNVAKINTVGNPDIRPERSAEREGGFELGIWQDRVVLDFTAFRKYTKDALVPRPVPLSIGLASSRAENIGDVRNTGVEATLTARPLDGPALSWDLGLGYSSVNNKLVTLGPGVTAFYSAQGYSPVQGDSRVVPGYPLFGRWSRPVLGYTDANDDGYIDLSEVRVGDTAVYVGPSQPKFNLSIRNSVGFLENRVRLSADMQYVHGFLQLNAYRAQNANTLPVGQLSGSPLAALAYYAAVGPTFAPVTYWGFYETSNVLRLTSLSASYTLTPRMAQLVRAQSATVYVLGNNLGLWSNYKGLDPDVNSALPSGNQVYNGNSLPQPKMWTFRVNLTY